MKRFFSIVIFTCTCALFASGCAEHRYYAKHRDHSARWYRHHPDHRPSIELKVRN